MSRQKYACRDKTFVATNIILSRQNFTRVTTKQDTCLSHKTFVATKDVLSVCRDKRKCLSRQTTKLCLSRQIFVVFLATKMIVVTALASDSNKHMFVATKTCLSQQKWYLWQLPPIIKGTCTRGHLPDWQSSGLLANIDRMSSCKEKGVWCESYRRGCHLSRGYK